MFPAQIRNFHPFAVARNGIDLRRDNALESAFGRRHDDFSLAVDLRAENHLVALFQIHALYTARKSPLHGYIVLFRIQAHSLARDEERCNIIVLFVELHVKHAVALV